METKRIFNVMLILMVLVCNVGCDQISKTIARNTLKENEYVTFVNDHVMLTKVENTGAFLSLGSTLPSFLRVMLLSIFPLAILGLAAFYVFSKPNLSPLTKFGACFVIGGGLGNLYDRIVHGSVTDFLHIDFVIFRTGVFNLADVSIMVGAFVIAFEVFRHRKLDAR
jgi:signal peptidase II